MIYSRWRPGSGGYDYFATSEQYGLGDDLPVPPLGIGSQVGVASTSVGRPIPRGARRAGSGPLARGVIAPLDTRGLSLSGLNVSVGSFGMLMIGIFAGWWFGNRERK